jgi:TM2 domain-containing membrane protein YozV
LISLSIYAGAQNIGEARFMEHLINRGDYREVIFISDMANFKPRGKALDSVNYFVGFAHYSLKELGKSTASFLKVGSSSCFYHKSHFFAAYNQIHLFRFDKAERILQSIETESPLLHSLRYLQLSGASLLNGENKIAEKYLANVDTAFSAMYDPLQSIKLLMLEHEKHKRKSPLLAGILSSLIPGAGKVYSGKTGQGIAGFISTVGFGLMAWENYRKLGPKNIKTIAFGAAFAGNYVANIHGSVKTAKLFENEYNEAFQNQVLFHLHVPLRNIFE